jgi:hypothetical protein
VNGNVDAVQRVLDIDLDFFVTPVIHWPQQPGRPPAEKHSVWPIEKAFEFLRERCRLDDRRPGFLTETHDELFPRWRQAVGTGVLAPPFHVTHVDAHADLGLGDAGYAYLMTSLLFSAPDDRLYPTPPLGRTGLTEGNFLLFAIACRWIASLEYIYGAGGGSDELSCVMRDFDPKADGIQLAAVTDSAFRNWNFGLGERKAVISHVEPEVAYRSSRWEQFHAELPYDFVCLTRSPRYAPATADPLSSEIAASFIEPIELENKDQTLS